MSDVKRYDLEQPDSHMGIAKMQREDYGDWVPFEDYTALRARLEAVEKRAEAARWNVDEDGNLVRLCRGDHDKDENCSDHEELFVPLDRAERAEAALATARRDGFLAGFKASGEGWNGEYPYEGDNPLEDKYFVDVMEREIRALANEADTSARGMPCPSR